MHCCCFLSVQRPGNIKSVSQRRIYLNNCTCCHTQTEAACRTCCLVQSQFIDSRPTTPRIDSTKPSVWRCSHKNICLLVACLTSQQSVSVSQGRIYSGHCTCCHTEIEVADQTFYLTQSQYTDTAPTSPRADSIMPGAWQGNHWSTIF